MDLARVCLHAARCDPSLSCAWSDHEGQAQERGRSLAVGGREERSCGRALGDAHAGCEGLRASPPREQAAPRLGRPQGRGAAHGRAFGDAARKRGHGEYARKEGRRARRGQTSCARRRRNAPLLRQGQASQAADGGSGGGHRGHTRSEMPGTRRGRARGWCHRFGEDGGLPERHRGVTERRQGRHRARARDLAHGPDGRTLSLTLRR